MKTAFNQTISNSTTLQDLIRFTSDSLGKIQGILNGNIDLVTNVKTKTVTATFTKINTDLAVGHNLGMIPRGYILIGSNNSLISLQNGKTANTSTTLYLQSGSTGIATVMVF